MDETNPKNETDETRLRLWGLGLALTLVVLQVILKLVA